MGLGDRAAGHAQPDAVAADRAGPHPSPGLRRPGHAFRGVLGPPRLRGDGPAAAELGADLAGDAAAGDPGDADRVHPGPVDRAAGADAVGRGLPPPGLEVRPGDAGPADRGAGVGRRLPQVGGPGPDRRREPAAGPPSAAHRGPLGDAAAGEPSAVLARPAVLAAGRGQRRLPAAFRGRRPAQQGADRGRGQAPRGHLAGGGDGALADRCQAGRRARPQGRPFRGPRQGPIGRRGPGHGPQAGVDRAAMEPWRTGDLEPRGLAGRLRGPEPGIRLERRGKAAGSMPAKGQARKRIPARSGRRSASPGGARPGPGRIGPRMRRSPRWRARPRSCSAS